MTSHQGMFASVFIERRVWFVCGWQVKLWYWSPCYTWAISECFRDKGLI